MTLTMTCDICGRSTTVTVDAVCSAAHHSSEPEEPPAIEIRPVPPSPLRWTEKFVHGKHGHECSDCTVDRRQRLKPQLDRISARHHQVLEEERSAAIAEWEQSRRPATTDPQETQP